MAKIYTIIVTYNGKKWIDFCLKSLKESSLKTKIIIIDNNSTDGTVQFVHENYSEITILKQNTNLGFGKANNIGISYALKKKADYVFLLNQDTTINKQSLEGLVKASVLNPDFGILSPIQLNWEGDQLEYYFSRFLIKNIDFYSHYVLKKETDLIYEIPFVNAAAWLLPRKTLETIGGFDPIFHHYGEDDNYCQRLAYHNLKIGVVPNTFINHDSNKRETPKDFLFTDKYYLQEIKSLQVKFANINVTYSEESLKLELKKINKLILINILKLNKKNIKGFYKKKKILAKQFKEIILSRKVNKVINHHYIEL